MIDTKSLDWNSLLQEALSAPGHISEAYSMFHRYSIVNRLWVIKQLKIRKLPLSPIASFNRWKELGRKVRKGEKALSMFVPCTNKVIESESNDLKYIITGFMVRNKWFSLIQTEGEEYVSDVLAGKWDYQLALNTLGIREEPFSDIDGNCGGYAKTSESVIAINPLVPQPWKIRFHEMAHCLLHKDDEFLSDSYQLDYSMEEVEAECVAYLCCASLNLPGIEESRGYIQLWMDHSIYSELTKKNIQRIFSAADRILSSGNAEKLKDKEYGIS